MKNIMIIIFSVLFLFSCATKPKTNVDIAREYFHQNDLVNAEKYYRLAMSEGRLAGYVGIGNVFWVKGELNKAEKAYLKAYAKGSNFALYKLAILNIDGFKDCNKGINYLIASSWSGVSEGIDLLRKQYKVVTQNVYRYDRDFGVDVLNNYSIAFNAAMARIINESNFSQKVKEAQFANYLNHNAVVINAMIKRCKDSLD